MTTFERNDRAVLVVLNRVDEVGAGASSTFLAAAATVALARSVVREIMLVTGDREPAESPASRRNLVLSGALTSETAFTRGSR